ncbi:hypothetical protein bthur0007_62250 [Bacillus thuringiensis serovar monterrey BGSC 4AJ1]|nr:hypothetical protein bthur0007_62250 [Bacillus thuringiensis serovar monterrey BGSC 4AJ1]
MIILTPNILSIIAVFLKNITSKLILDIDVSTLATEISFTNRL